LVAVLVRTVVAVPLGLAAGFLGGRVDQVVTRVADLVMAVPAIVILLSVLTLFGNDLLVAMAVFGLLGAAGLVRIVRGAALTASQELHVTAGRLMGLSPLQVAVRHVLPRCRGVVIVQTTLFATIALGVQTGLSFLGLGAPPPEPTWGAMVGEAASVVQSFPWLLVPTGGVIAVTVLALGVLGDVVRDVTADRSTASGGRRARRRSRSVPEPAPRGGPDVLLDVRDLEVTFLTASGEVTVVQGVDLDVRPGETVGLVGESGSGKSVVAKAVLGLLPRNGTVTGGGAWFGGKELTGLGGRQWRGVRGSQIALVAQDPLTALDPTARIGAQVGALVRTHDRVGRRAARARVVELLEQVQVIDPEEVARRYPHEISGGMAQRVAIAMALAGRPRLLIADEPTTALDVTVQAEVLDLLRSLQEQTGMAILLVTHDWGVVADVCERVVVLYAGEVVERADVDRVFSTPAHPYTRALLDASPDRPAPDGTLRTVPGSVPPPDQRPVGCHFAARCPRVRPDCTEEPVPMTELADARLARCLHPLLPVVPAGATAVPAEGSR
jgi:oligopeptide/dipeptide ABC transporter ATP-binding protein